MTSVFQGVLPSCPNVIQTAGHRFLVGQYASEEGSRVGGLTIFEKSPDTRKIRQVDQLDLGAGILDICPFEGDQLLLALSDGNLCVYPQLEYLPLFGDLESHHSCIIGCDCSDSQIAGLSAYGQLKILANGQTLTEIGAHPQTEAWAVTFLSPTLVATGGDEGALKIFDLRMGQQCEGNTQSHQAGVTSLLHESEHLLLTGSYDEYLRRFDCRKLNQPLQEVRTSGGIWQMSSQGSNLYLACCFGEAETRDLESLELQHSYRGSHTSLIYDYVGWGNFRISCSYYDKLVEVWQS